MVTEVNIETELLRAVRQLAPQIEEAVSKLRKSEIVIRFDESGRVVGDKVVTSRGR